MLRQTIILGFLLFASSNLLFCSAKENSTKEVPDSKKLKAVKYLRRAFLQCGDSLAELKKEDIKKNELKSCSKKIKKAIKIKADVGAELGSKALPYAMLYEIGKKMGTLRQKEQKKNLDQIIAFEPNNAHYLRERAGFYNASGKLFEAKKDFKQSLSFQYDEKSAVISAYLSMLMQDYVQAIIELQYIVSLNPDCAEALLYLGSSKIMLGEIEDGKSYLIFARDKAKKLGKHKVYNSALKRLSRV